VELIFLIGSNHSSNYCNQSIAAHAITHTLIIGASAAGLASAACLKKEGIEFIILEKSSQVATSWRNHYDRLHLHTSKKWSALPFREFERSIPKYPGRQQVVNYLDSYANEFNIHPVFNTTVYSARKENGHWITETNNDTYQSKFVIVATGLNHTPQMPVFTGMDSFKGKIVHSSQYKNGIAFKDKSVLVVGLVIQPVNRPYVYMNMEPNLLYLFVRRSTYSHEIFLASRCWRSANLLRYYSHE
jgi:cation diffusion facilitator CzcD-associated flavoprotein CzcO